MTTNGSGHPGAQHRSTQAPPPQVQQAMLAQVVTEMQKLLDDLVKQNQGGFQELARRGVNFEGLQILNMRIDTLAKCVSQVLGPQGDVWLLKFATDFEQNMATAIEEARTQGTKAQLAMGGSLSASAIRDLAKQTRTFGG